MTWPKSAKSKHGLGVIYPPELRREAAMYCILGGHSPEAVAERIGCTAQSVRGWVKKTLKEMEEKGEA